MKKTIRCLALLFVAVFTASQVFAASSWTEETAYPEKAKAKLAFGIKNVLLGWTDLLNEPERYHDEGKNVLAGAGKGLMDLVVNTVGGVLHIVTFPVTKLDVPLPEGGVSL